MLSRIATRLLQDTGRFGAAGLGKEELTDLKRLGLCFFSEFSKKQKKQWPTVRVFQPSPPWLDGRAQKLGNSYYLWDDCELITSKVCSQNCSRGKEMFESHLETYIEWTSFEFWSQDFFQRSATENKHLLCYWPTTHNLISKTCYNFQVLSSQFCEVNDLFDEHWAKIVRRENISTPI